MVKQVQSVDDAVTYAFEVLVNNSKWKINYATLYSDYFSYAKGEDIIQSVGWSWINTDESFTRCIKVMYGDITDYYFSYENHTNMIDGAMYSKQVDPDTFETIATYYMSNDGCHKYNITKSDIIGKNSYQEIDLSANDVLSGTNLDSYKNRQNTLLTSRKSYGDMIYICNKDYSIDHLIKNYA